MPVMSFEEADIYYELTGSGNPPLVFIHGFTCDHSDWDFQVKHFSGTNRVISCDLRGHGQSTGGNKRRNQPMARTREKACTVVTN